MDSINNQTKPKYPIRIPLKDFSFHFKELLRFSTQEINKVNFKCLLNPQHEIKKPVRGNECLHLECYDEESLINELEKLEQEGKDSISCKRCGKYLHKSNLVVDHFLYTILRLRGRGQKSICVNKLTGKWSFVENKNLDIKITDKVSSSKAQAYNEDYLKYPEIIIYPKLNESGFNVEVEINKEKLDNILTRRYLTNIEAKNSSSPAYITNNKTPSIFLNFSSSKTNLKEKSENNQKLNKFTIYCDIYELFCKIIKNDEDKTNSLLIIRELFVYLHYLFSICSDINIYINKDFLDKINNLLFESKIKDLYVNSYIHNETDELFFVFLLDKFLKLHSCNVHFEDKHEMKEKFTKNELIKIYSFSDYKNYSFLKYENTVYDYIYDIFNGFINLEYFEKINLSNNTKNNTILDLICIPKPDEKDFSKLSIQCKNKSLLNNIHNFTNLNKIFTESKFLITSGFLFSNFANNKENVSFCPIEINLEDLSYILFPKLDLLNQFIKLVSTRNYFFTNSTEYNSLVSAKILKGKALNEFLEKLSYIKSRTKVFFLFVEELKKNQLERILNLYPNITKVDKTGEFTSEDEEIEAENEEDCIIQEYVDKDQVKYYFFLEQENQLKIFMGEKIENILNEVSKLKMSSLNPITIRNKDPLISHNNTYEIRKINEY